MSLSEAHTENNLTWLLRRSRIMATKLLGTQINLEESPTVRAGSTGNLYLDDKGTYYWVLVSDGVPYKSTILGSSGKKKVTGRGGQLEKLVEHADFTLEPGYQLDHEGETGIIPIPPAPGAPPAAEPAAPPAGDTGWWTGVAGEGTGTMSATEQAAAKKAEQAAAQKKRHQLYAGLMGAGEVLASIPKWIPTEYEREISERAEETPEGMSATEEADLTRFILSPAQQMARESRLCLLYTSPSPRDS